jgi:hypothetical protein
MEFSNDDLQKKLFIRYNVGKKINKDGDEVSDNVLLFVSTLENVEEVEQFVSALPDGRLQPINVFDIKNNFVSDKFILYNTTKTNNFVITPLKKDFNNSEFISKYIQTNVSEIPKRALQYILEEKVEIEEYEIAAILRDEIFKREESTEVNE